MKPIKKIFYTHLFLWLLLSLVYFASSEIITKKLFPGYHDVTLWLMVTITGLILLFILTMISFLIKLIARKKATADQTTSDH